MLATIVLGYVIFSLICGGVLVMIVIGDRVHSRNGEQHPQESVQASPEPSTENQDHSSSAVSVDHAKLQRYG